MEANIDLVEKLVEKTGVTYTEAKAVLEKTDWDILEALIALEAEGRINKSDTSGYSTRDSSGEYREDSEKRERKEHRERKERKTTQTGENFKSTGKSFGETIRDLFDKGNSNSIEMYRNDVRQFGMPVNVFILLLILGFWIIVPLMIVGLFCGCRYAFSGKELGKDNINNAMGKANDFADGIKTEIKNEMNKEKENREN